MSVFLRLQNNIDPVPIWLLLIETRRASSYLRLHHRILDCFKSSCQAESYSILIKGENETSKEKQGAT